MSSDSSLEPTTYYVRLAKSGDTKSLQWLVNRFSPILLAKAKQKISDYGRGRVLPEDIVAEAWLVVLSRLSDLGEYEGRSTPVFVKFLFRVLDKKCQEAWRRDADPQRRQHSDLDCTQVIDPAAQLIRQIVMKERKGEVLAALAAVDPDDAQLLLRYMADEKVNDLAEELGLPANTLSKRFQRLIRELRAVLGASVFDDYRDQ